MKPDSRESLRAHPAYAEELSAEQRIQLLEDVTTVLASSVDYEQTLENVAKLTVEWLADWCIVDLLQGDQLVRVTSAHRDPAKQELVNRLVERYPIGLDRPDHPVWTVMRTGEPVLVEQFAEGLLNVMTVNEEHRQILQALGIWTGLLVPLQARGRLIGVLSFARGTESSPKFTKADVGLARQIAVHAAVALDNASLHRAAQEAEDELRLLANNIGEVLYVLQPEPLQVLFASLAIERMWETSLAELRQRPMAYLDRVHEDDREQVLSALASQRQGLSTEVTYRVVRSDGEVHWILDRAFPIHTDQGRLFRIVGIAEDITEDKEVQELLLEAKREAERANQAKSEFLSRMSHELRTPLNAILGFGQLLKSSSLPTEDQESAEQVLQAGRHLLSLVDEVLDLARIEAGSLSFSLESVSLVQAVEESLKLVQPLATEREVSLHLGEGFRENPFVHADFQRLKQVLLNLISNAIKYNQFGGDVWLECRNVDPEHCRIEVRDNGPGISHADLGRLFSPFERVGTERSRVKGTGLGLTISQGLVERMGGRIGVESALGQGSTFWVVLSRGSAPHRTPVIEREEDAPPVVTDAPARRILYIEDDHSNIRLVERVLAQWAGLELTSAELGVLGLEIARQHPPDLILLDMHLPDLDGAEVFARLRQESRLSEVPVVVTSADLSPQRMDRLLEAGVHAYLTKPLDIPAFLQVVDRCLSISG